MVDLDIFYATNKTFLLDLRIIFKTIPAIVSQTKDIKDNAKTDKKPVLPSAPTEQRQC
jgi:lipopolysaccharide/colanic/teichoic acid biosynthesis glycosyltransferase